MGADQKAIDAANRLSMEEEDVAAAEPSPGSYERLAGLVSARRPG